MRTIKEAKSRMNVGVRLLCVENTYRPELNGTIRVVTQVGATRWQWKFEGKEDERPSHSYWPSGIKIIDNETIRIPLSEGHHLTLRFLTERTGPVDGPWIVDEINTANGPAYQISHLWTDGEGTHVDEVCQVCMDYHGTRSLDTANLISAAPDMLSALRAIIAEEDRLLGSGECFTNLSELIEAARPAVARAEGRINAKAEGIQGVRQSHEEAGQSATEAEGKTETQET